MPRLFIGLVAVVAVSCGGSTPGTSTPARSPASTPAGAATVPLYYVVTDHNPGDATGEAVNNFGAPWYVLGPDGNKIAS